MTANSDGTDKKEVKEAALLEAALDVFADLGFRKAGIGDIAKRAGIANGTIYLYAENKNDLYHKAVEYGFGAWQRRSIEAADRAWAETGRVTERLTALCQTAFDYLAQDQRLRRILSHDRTLFPAVASSEYRSNPLERINAVSTAQIERILRDGVARGEFDLDEPMVAAELLFSLYRVLVGQSYEEDFPSVQRRFNSGLKLILNGLRHR